jgi:A/G-specific adenine glycosylase
VHSPDRLAEVRAAVLAWYHPEDRPLPWRRTSDPYAVLVSEIMLQQTQAARVEPLYRAFLQRFPTVVALAAASAGDVVRAWQGLGYNRRAVALHRAAQAIVQHHGGRVPADLPALRALPGIGDYTARAVLAFAYGADAAPVDTNIARVLSRAVSGRPLGRAALQALADECLPPGRGADWSAAVMDLGAGVCTARVARCDACPLAGRCAWQREGGADPAAASGVRPRSQASFAQSDRYHRGRLVDSLRSAHVPVPRAALPAAAQLDDAERLQRIVQGLVDDGLAAWTPRGLCLPG